MLSFRGGLVYGPSLSEQRGRKDSRAKPVLTSRCYPQGGNTKDGFGHITVFQYFGEPNIMANYYMRTSIIKASSGKSAIASAAYQSGQKLHSTRLDQTFSYDNKEEVVFSEVLLPKDAPPEYSDREKLWNAVEEVQNKANSRYARQFIIAVPNEWTREEAIDHAREYIQNAFVDRGMAVDWAFHEKNGKTCNELGICHSSIDTRIKTGCSFEEAVEEAVKKSIGSRSVYYKGKIYKGYKEVYNAIKPNVSLRAFRDRISNGYSIDEAAEADLFKKMSSIRVRYIHVYENFVIKNK